MHSTGMVQGLILLHTKVATLLKLTLYSLELSKVYNNSYLDLVTTLPYLHSADLDVLAYLAADVSGLERVSPKNYLHCCRLLHCSL